MLAHFLEHIGRRKPAFYHTHPTQKTQYPISHIKCQPAVRRTNQRTYCSLNNTATQRKPLPVSHEQRVVCCCKLYMRFVTCTVLPKPISSAKIPISLSRCKRISQLNLVRRSNSQANKFVVCLPLLSPT